MHVDLAQMTELGHEFGDVHPGPALELARGLTHDFIKMGRVIPDALIAHQDAARALRHAFDTG